MLPYPHGVRYKKTNISVRFVTVTTGYTHSEATGNAAEWVTGERGSLNGSETGFSDKGEYTLLMSPYDAEWSPAASLGLWPEGP